MNARASARRVIASLPMPLARRLLYFHRFGRFPRVRNPGTFQEKLNARILFDRRRILVTASSKVLSKKYVEAKRIDGLRVPVTFWHGTNLSDIDGRTFEGLWVLKPSHRSGGVHIAASPVFLVDDLPERGGNLLSEREYRRSKLWAYKLAPRELLIEERLDPSATPDDYKFFVFHGVVMMIQVDSGRFGDHRRVLYSRSWVPRSETFGMPRGVPSPPPDNLEKMVRIAERLGEDFDFVRVDLYSIRGEVYFGELTVYPGGGLSPWPRSLDAELGAVWSLPPEARRRGVCGRRSERSS